MLRSSCERFLCGPFYITVFRKRNSVEISFDRAPDPTPIGNVTGTVASNSITITDGTDYIPGAIIGNQQAILNRQGYASSTVSASSHFNCIGFRLFLKDGFLKCVKREVAMSYYVTTVSATTASLASTNDIPASKVRESFYHPAAIGDSIDYTPECSHFIMECVLDLAEQNGIEVPQKFRKFGKHNMGLGVQNYFAYLDWLAYPLVREINNVVVCKNMINWDRNFISPKFEPMNFKELINHHYETSTPKLLEEIWKVLTVGGDYRRHVFHNLPDIQKHKDYVMGYNGAFETLEEGPDYIIQTGDRHIQSLVFTLGPAILRTLGFDYFYQAIPYFGNSFSRRFDPLDNNSAKALEFDLSEIKKHVSPKKILSVLFQEDPAQVRETTDPERYVPAVKKPDLHSMHDAARMLRDYDSFEKIPSQLRLQYPRGLTVDFKFKTMKELHDKISTQYTIIKTEAARRPIPVVEVYAKLNGMEKDGLKLIVPKDTSVLAVWGKLLNICIASYGDRAVRGETLLLGVEQEDRIKYCIEFRSVLISRTAHAPATVYEHGEVPKEAQIIREAYPRLQQKHCGVVPPDTPEEEEYYFTPSMVQFRGDRNGDPSKEDRNAVETMLANWVKDNMEELKQIKDLFEDSKRDYGGIIMDGINNVMNQYIGGRADQLIMNPAAYDALVRQLGDALPDNAEVENLQVNGNQLNVNVRVNPHMAVDQVYLQPNGDLPVIINNLALP